MPVEASSLPEELVGPVARGSLVGLAGAACGRLTKFLLNVVLAKALGAGAYGLFSIGFSVNAVLLPLAGLGQRMAIVKHFAEYQSKEQAARLKGCLLFSLKSTAISSAVFMVALYWSADWVARRVFHATGIAFVLQLFSLGLPPLAFLSLAAGVAQGLIRIDRSTLTEDVLFPGANLVMAGLFLLLGGGLRGAVLATRRR